MCDAFFIKFAAWDPESCFKKEFKATAVTSKKFATILVDYTARIASVTARIASVYNLNRCTIE